MLKTLVAAGLAAATGFANFEDPSKTTYGNQCQLTPPQGPRGESGAGYGFDPAFPLWDAKCMNENCARESGNSDGGKTGGWTKNNKKCSSPSEVGITIQRSGRQKIKAGCQGARQWELQEECLAWCVGQATLLGYQSTNYPNTQYCCELQLTKTHTCKISLDGSPGFKTPTNQVYTAIQVFSTSCSAEYSDPTACAAD
jgi:hypothetical protein